MNRKHSKRIALIVTMCMVAMSAFCIPAKKVWRTMTLTDGTTIEAMMIGDEHGHWFVDHNGNALQINDSGKMEFMTSEQLSNVKALRKERIARINTKRMQRINEVRVMSAESNTTAASSKRKEFGKPTTLIGKKKGIVILVNFSDKSFKTADSLAVFNRRFNEIGFNDNGYVGSVHDYFYDQSYGKFDLTFDVIGPVTLSNKHDYYGANDLIGNDKYAATMVIEALKLADAQGVDFSQYDWNGNGEVDQVFVIYAGTGEAASNNSKDIWPHEYSLSEAKEDGDGSGTQTIDGVKIDTYACSCELASSTTIDGIGCACHEFAHCLGYADLYDIDYSGGVGMECWDLLDGGSYNGPKMNGEVPAPFTSFERWWAGWMDLPVLDNPQFIKDMPAINDEGVAYKIENDAHPDEYYLLENRQAKKWDLYTGGDGDGTGHGMMILHVDYDETAWENDAPNDDPNHQRMTFFPADNSYGTKYSYGSQYQWSETYEQSASDPFPGTKGNTSFTDDSKPASTLYNANTDGRKYMGKSITDITETDGLISFTFMGGIEIPKAEQATNINRNGTSFTANWNTVDGADSYDLEIAEAVQGTPTPVISEDFSNVTGNVNADISASLDNYTTSKGWTGSKVYASLGKIKIGASLARGYIISPEQTAPTSGKVTVKLSVAAYNANDTKMINIRIIDSNGNTMQLNEGVSIKTLKADYVYSFDGINNAYKVEIETYATNKCRFNLYSINIYDGEYTADDLSESSSEESNNRLCKTVNIISGITDTHYTVTGLTPNVDYMYRVRANIDGQHSNWCNYIDATPTTAIEAITYDEVNKPQRIYNLNGQYVGSDINDLPRGLYIIGTRKFIKK